MEELNSILASSSNIATILDEKIFLSSQVSRNPTIFGVDKAVRSSNPLCYTPQFVTIGPLHRNSDMEHTKYPYIRSFLCRTNEKSITPYIEVIQTFISQILQCYKLPVDFDSNKFIEKMVIDSCFVVEFIMKNVSGVHNGQDFDPIFSIDNVKNQVCLDLILLENQLPFFILVEIYNKNGNELKEPFADLAKMAFLNIFPKICPGSVLTRALKEQEIHHLLHLVHIICRPPSEQSRLEGGSGRNSNCYNMMYQRLSSATALGEAGVQFKSIGKVYTDIRSLLDFQSLRDEKSIFDIQFDKGTLEIPSFKVDNYTEGFLRNLIAFEQQSPSMYPKYFSDFALLMHDLIKTKEDVHKLQLEGILVNRLGDDEQISQLFLKIGEGLIVSENFYYTNVCHKIQEYRNKTWNLVSAKLKHYYFNDLPSSILSVTNMLIFVFTMIQIIVSIWCMVRALK